MRKIATLICVAALSVSSIAQAQAIDSGSIVRVTPVGFGEQKLIGRLISMNRDSVKFESLGLNMTTGFRTADLKKIEVSRGTRTHMWKGVLIGFTSCAIVAGGLTAATWHPTNSIDFGRWGDAGIVAIPAGAIGALIGSFVGAVPMESWQTIPLPSP